jgi:serine protease Do
MLHPLLRGLLAAALALALPVATPAVAGSPTPALQTAVRASTLEVVLRKVEADPLSYEKPLPVEMIPYVVRTDAYWSIGTAFAVGPNTYVSAGHVLLAAVGSQCGTPALRDTAGHVYPIDRVLQFSGHEDYVVFTVSGAPPAVPLPTSADHQLDAAVFAVGNALGEGVVIRDGLLTSETAEQQDGRWKWLRFSAAASPGNSGGPLLDADGRVIGVVLAKSPNENLNYALPIGRVLNPAGPAGTIDVRYTIKLPITRDAEVATLKAQFRLPESFADFAREYLDTVLRTGRADRDRLLKAQAGKLVTKGNSTRLLATVYESTMPAFVQQKRDDSWDAVAAGGEATVDLPPKGLVTTGSDLGVTVFRLRRPAAASDDGFYKDSRAFMDLLLRGLKLTREVGPQAVRITSLGGARQDSLYTDRYGRRWQVRSWPLGHVDSYVVSFCLPAPDGYAGFVHETKSAQLDSEIEELKLLADYFYVSYSGTLPQWRAFMNRSALRPAVFDKIRIEAPPAGGVTYSSPRLALAVPRQVLATTDQSVLVLEMSYFLDGDVLAWDVGALRLWKEDERKTYVAAERHVQPLDTDNTELSDTWQQIRGRRPGYNGVAGHDAAYKSYWIRDVVSAPAPAATAPGVDPAARVLYTLGYGTDANALPHDLEESLRLLRRGMQVLEH